MAKRNGLFRKFRGVDDKTLGMVLGNHADTLRGIANAVTMLLRERRLLLVLEMVQTLALIWVLLKIQGVL